MSLTAIMKGFASRSLPQPVPDAQDQEMRLGRYGDVYTIPALSDYYALTGEGSYFVGANPTIGTGIAFGAAASTSFNDTTGAGLVIMNTDQSPSGTIGKRLGNRLHKAYLHYGHRWNYYDSVLSDGSED
jgi:hypothetical protein